MYIPIFDRDMLYPTGNNLDPGSVDVAVMSPNSQGNLPVFLSAKSNHKPMEYMDILLDIIQSEIFDRTGIDIKSQCTFFILDENDEYIKLVWKNGKQIIERSINIQIQN